MPRQVPVLIVKQPPTADVDSEADTADSTE